ncbi:MAG: CDP-alcohol phosphatidyltransferase family protein [Actinobacteria bacterium]|nr:CDP-alcohol phosphatidyltransferase family protein [Actinomycetota bacterium]
MLQSRLRGPVSVLITPICRFLLQIGLRANHLTVIGAFGSSICAIYFFSQGKFLVGTLLVTIFLLTDLLDGTMARLSSGTGTKWGAFLDSTVDRIADAALLIGILAYISEQSGKNFSRWSEAVGIGERTERLVVLLIGTGFYGLGFDAAIDTSLWLVLVMSTVTVIQRVIVVARA